MAQHDYVIANGTGAAVRSDLNNALAAIVSNNSGATEPATMYAYQWWADTSTGLLKLRNAANNAWITLRELDGTLTIEDGTASSPGLAFADDLNTGIYSPSADQLGITTGGTVRLTTTTTGITSALPVDVPLGTASAPTVTFTGDLNTGIYSPGADQVAISTNGSGRLFVNSAGSVGIGSSSPQTLLHLANTTQQRFYCTSTQNAIAFWKDGTPTFAAEVGIGSATGLTSTMKFDIYNGSAWNTAMTIDSSSRVGIGITPAAQLDVKATSGTLFRCEYTGVAQLNIGNGGNSINYYDGDTQIFRNGGGTERARIDSSGRLLVGTSSSATDTYHGVVQIEGLDAGNGVSSRLQLRRNTTTVGNGPGLVFDRSRGTTLGSFTAVQSGDLLGTIAFRGANGSTVNDGAFIEAFVDGAVSGGGVGDMPTRLVFSTTADGASSPTEALRITSGQNIRIGTTAEGAGFNNGRVRLVGNTGGLNSIYCEQTQSGGYSFASNCVSNGGTYYHANFMEVGTSRGSITSNGSSTTYSTSSDYRLKENIELINDGIARLQQLKPSRFNFIENAANTVDGFIAHEVQAVVPEAIVGEKDAVDDDGNPIYQGIDQSKLVPLLTAALQEAITKIETLEAKVAALEAA